MTVAKVGVKFCGNCNPRISGRKLLEQIKAELPEAVWLPADSSDKDILLVLSGCPVDCASRPEWNGPTIVVAGETIDREVCYSSQLAGMVNQKLKAIRQKLNQ